MQEAPEREKGVEVTNKQLTAVFFIKSSFEKKKKKRNLFRILGYSVHLSRQLPFSLFDVS